MKKKTTSEDQKAATASGGATKSKKQRIKPQPIQEPRKRRRWCKRLVLRRALMIFEQLQDNKYPNAKTLSKLLEVTPRVATEDVEAMRDDLELPIAYDAQKHGYYFTEPVYSFPIVALTNREIFTLYLTNPTREQYEGTEFKQTVDSAFRKLLGPLDKNQKELLESMAQEISFRPAGPEPVDIDLFETLRHAIHERRVIEFLYLKPSDDVPVLRRVDPYHVTMCDGVWYLLTRDHQANAIRKFRLGRMSELNVVGQKFEWPKNFSLKKVFANCFGVKSGDGDYTVVVHLSKIATRTVGDRHLYALQDRKLLPDGSSRLTFHLDCLDEIERWILDWGTEATAEGPLELRQRLYKKAMLVAGKYLDVVGSYGLLAGNAEIKAESKKHPPSHGYGATGKAEMECAVGAGI